MRMQGHAVAISSRVLVYREGDQFIAHALELDLIGTGDSPNKAMKDLDNALTAQVSFCAQKDMLDSLFFPAPKEYAARWLEAARHGVQDLAAGDVAAGVDFFATVITMDQDAFKKAIAKASRGRFSEAGETCCAKA